LLPAADLAVAQLFWLIYLLTASGRITRGPEGAWPPERPGGPLETPGLRGYKGASITGQIQYMIATYQYHSKHRWW